MYILIVRKRSFTALNVRSPDVTGDAKKKPEPPMKGFRLLYLRLDDLRLQIELFDLRFTIDEHQS